MPHSDMVFCMVLKAKVGKFRASPPADGKQVFAVSPPRRPKRHQHRKHQARMEPAPACSSFVRLRVQEGQFVSSGRGGGCLRL